MLAQVITYYNIIENRTASYLEIVKYFKEKAYLLANTLINENFKIDFQEPTSLEDSFFLNNSPFQ